jgi:hypothetical protein
VYYVYPKENVSVALWLVTREYDDLHILEDEGEYSSCAATAMAKLAVFN